MPRKFGSLRFREQIVVEAFQEFQIGRGVIISFRRF